MSMFGEEGRGATSFILGAILGFLFYKVVVKLFWITLRVIEWLFKWARILSIRFYYWAKRRWDTYQLNKTSVG